MRCRSGHRARSSFRLQYLWMYLDRPRMFPKWAGTRDVALLRRGVKAHTATWSRLVTFTWVIASYPFPTQEWTIRHRILRLRAGCRLNPVAVGHLKRDILW